VVVDEGGEGGFEDDGVVEAVGVAGFLKDF
jgi:hypothetical protein